MPRRGSKYGERLARVLHQSASKWGSSVLDTMTAAAMNSAFWPFARAGGVHDG